MPVVVLHQGLPERSRFSIAELVEAIGTDEFGTCLIRYLNDVCGADHFAIFQLGSDSMSALTFNSFDRSRHVAPMVERYIGDGLWREDPAVSVARSHLDTSFASLIRADLDDEGYSHLRPRVYPLVRDRVVVCGRRESIDFGLSVLRSQSNAQFGPGAIERLAGVSDTLLSTMAKHVSVLTARPNPAAALTDLAEIMKCVATRSLMPRREVEVCARILYGMSTLGIALDIGVGEESVRTYRKRAYQRLRIGTGHELLRWYLTQWSAWRFDHTPRTTLHRPRKRTRLCVRKVATANSA